LLYSRLLFVSHSLLLVDRAHRLNVDTPEETHDILHSIGALGQQVKASEKQKANENKAKGYAKAKSISQKYG
jgi:hypothetical protein